VENKDNHLSHRFLDRDQSGAAFVQSLRRRGVERFDAVGFPNTRQEEWRLTNVAPLSRIPFNFAEPDDSGGADAIAAEHTLGADSAAELVIVNGLFDPKLSRLARLPRGVTIAGLGTSLDHHAAAIEPHLGQHAQVEKNPFVALNASFLRDGAYVHVPRGVIVEKPIHLLYIATASRPVMSHPRTLIVIEEGASATIVETYVGGANQIYWTNAVTEIIAGPGSQIDHCKLQRESMAAFHISTTQVNLAASANFVTHSATLGAALTRNDLNVIMAGARAEATLNGLVVLTGRQHADNHTLLDHTQPNCPSHELYKHVLADQSVGVFKGKILVRRPAQKTDSKQTSKSLLLSDQAVMNSQPALEIYADDVKCTHGSTTGPVDEEMVFYLRSRGVDLAAARHLLSYAFAADITRRIRVATVRQRLEDYLAAQHGLPSDLRITDLGDHNERSR
jgi:Fe-S cluster assembly protein SufD